MLKQEYYEKGQIILEPGQIATSAWFIKKGSAAGFVEKEEKKVSFWLWNKGELIVPFNSFFNQVPSKSYIELLEPSVLISVSFDQMNTIMKGFPQSDDYIKRIMKDFHKKDEKNFFDFPTYDRQEQYPHHLKDYPEFFKRASQESIAAYLGVTQETIYRIRTRRSKF